MKLSIKGLTASFISLMGFWYLMSGFFDLVHTIMGVLCVGTVMFINYQLKVHSFYDGDKEAIDDLRYFYVPFYFVWLLWQIIVAGIQVAKILISPSLPIKTTVVRFKVDFPNPQCKMILGNSITLTPGTITVDINNDEFIVHSISPVSYEGIASDKIPQHVLKLFTKEQHPVVSDFEVITSKEEL